MGPRAGLDTCGKYRPHTGIRSLDRAAHSQSLYRLSYRAHKIRYRYYKNMRLPELRPRTIDFLNQQLEGEIEVLCALRALRA